MTVIANKHLFHLYKFQMRFSCSYYKPVMLLPGIKNFEILFYCSSSYDANVAVNCYVVKQKILSAFLRVFN